MLIGERTRLRARLDSDVAVLHAGLYEDVATRSRSDARPWRPVGQPQSPYAVDDRPLAERATSSDIFSVLELATGELAGDALLWGLDAHNRFAHLGISLLPDYRGRGLAADVIRVLCVYGFQTRGLQRLQLETLDDNVAMCRTALSCGFTREGTLRRAAWVSGEFLDEAIFGLLVDEWRRD